MSDASTPISSDDRTTASVAPALVQSIATTPIVQDVVEPQVSSRNREKGSISAAESQPTVEVNAALGSIEQEPIPEAVEAWMEKVGQEEAEINLETLPSVQVPPPAPVTSSTSKPVFVLPLGQEEMKIGLHASVNDSIRWLATWATRIMKQLKGETAFRA